MGLVDRFQGRVARASYIVHRSLLFGPRCRLIECISCTLHVGLTTLAVLCVYLIAYQWRFCVLPKFGAIYLGMLSLKTGKLDGGFCVFVPVKNNETVRGNS